MKTENMNAENMRVACDLCGGLILKDRNSLRRHTSKFHRTVPSSLLPPQMKCGVCNESLAKHDDLESHLKSAHDISIEHERLSFSSQEDFKTWLRSVEEKDDSKFIKRNSKTSDEKRVTYYRCNRSGQARLLQEQTRKRRMKIQGTVKTGFQCPARITCWTFPTGVVKIDHCKTHAFHTKQLKPLPLPSPKKKEIAAKISAKIPFQKILHDVGQSAKTKKTSVQGLARIRLANMQDLRNIDTIRATGAAGETENEERPEKGGSLMEDESHCLQIVEEENHEEATVRLNSICRDNYNTDRDLEAIRGRIQGELTSLLRSINTKEGLLAFEQKMKSAKRILQATEKLSTHSFGKGAMRTNKRAEPQRQFQTKNKKKTGKLA